MSSLEFLSVLISVVVGLAITHLLSGGNLLRRRGEHLSAVHATWTVFVFGFLVIYWWTIVFGWQERETWNILLCLFVLSYGVLLYLLCVVVYPSTPPSGWDLQAHFLAVRRWFFGIWMATLAAELFDTWLKGHFDDLAVAYVPLIATWFILTLWGLRTRNPRHHLTIALIHPPGLGRRSACGSRVVDGSLKPSRLR